MTIEYAILASIITLAIRLFNFTRQIKKDAGADSSQMTTVIIKLENIQQGVNELKKDVTTVKSDLKDMDRRLTIAEESLKSAWKTIDSMTGKEKS